jgi:hypothetical protein
VSVWLHSGGALIGIGGLICIVGLVLLYLGSEER